jgi:hypothetical protein
LYCFVLGVFNSSLKSLAYFSFSLSFFFALFAFFPLTLGLSDRRTGCAKSSRRGKVEKVCILKLLYCWDMYRIEIQKDTDTILKILLSRDTKYRFVSLSICIVSNRKIRIVNRKILTSMISAVLTMNWDIITHRDCKVFKIL